VKRIEERLLELKSNFYNRLDKEKQIKRHGKIPFIEHMTLSKSSLLNSFSAASEPIVLPENTTIHDDIKRELVL
jgi:predicted GTPase